MENNFAIFVGVLLSICAAITTLGSAAKTLGNFRKPYDDLKNRVLELEEANKSMKDDIDSLEERIKSYVDQMDIKNSQSMDNLKEDIDFLKMKIEKNETDAKLILKQLLAIGGVIADPEDEEWKNKVRQTNCDLLEHLIEK